MISHDREFLDKVADHIMQIEQRQLQLYRGNYSSFERKRAQQLANQQALYDKQQQRIKEIQSFVTRFRAKATKARQAQSRLKELERMDNIAAAYVDSPFQFLFPQATKLSDPLLNLSKASVAYGDNVLLQDIKLILHPGSRIGLLGANGAGKSTLIKTLLAELPLYGGERVEGEHLRIGYFAQHQLEELELDTSPFDHIQRLSPEAQQQTIRDFLGGFNFQGDRVFESVRPFSGGEKARLALAIVVWQRPNLLLLDEPTNHLDLEMCHALTMALQQFNGAMVLVSHDRNLLRNSVDEFWLIAEGSVKPFDGDLDDYQRLLSKRDKTSTVNSPERKPGNNQKTQRRQAAAKRQQISPLKHALKQLEEELQQHHQQLGSLEARLADHDLYSDDNKSHLQQLLQEQGILKKQIKEIEEKWLQQHEQLDMM